MTASGAPPARQAQIGRSRNGTHKALLKSGNNPHGWNLEELLARIRAELDGQLLAICGPEPSVKARLAEYQKVIAALYEAEGRYRTLGPP